MELLDEIHSWDLLSKIVFGGEGRCPPELEEIGKEIGKSCKGLPLSIVVTGGFLAKSPHTTEFWKHIEDNLSLTVNLEEYDRCLEILYMSYKQLPIYLKPCFLYMGVFPEDEEIKISTLVKLWVAEGFLKPVSGESTLEEIARLYLKDLADRNLLLIHKMSFKGNIKQCKIHDLLRELCLREAEKERFYTLTPQGMVNGQRRIVINNAASKNEVMNAVPSMSPVRSLFWNLEEEEELPASNLRLPRILHSSTLTFTQWKKIVKNVHQFVNPRFLQFEISLYELRFPLSIWKSWNLQTLIIGTLPVVNAPTDIWYMPHLRHIYFDHMGINLPDPPEDEDDIVLGNLKTLVGAADFKCSDEVIKRIPNIKKLQTNYVGWSVHDGCLSNLNRLEKLESLDCRFYSFSFPWSQINFPNSLKKLSLEIYEPNYWEQEVLDKIGSLPSLQKLKLDSGPFEDGKWETTEGQFCSLKFLYLEKCKLKVWTTESSHFPCLSHLRLARLFDLEEIPLELAEVSTLGQIEVWDCTDSAVVSLKGISEENEALSGVAEFEVDITLWRSMEEIQESKTALEGLTGPNFRIQWKEERK